MSLPPGFHLGSYRILAQLGSGGMGEVYRARDERLGRDVAIKVLPEGFAEDAGRLRRFEIEARALAALSHPGIVTVFEVGSHEGLPYLVMELLEGRTLRSTIDGRPMPVPQVVEIGRALAQALAEAHEKGILHRDLKPENVFLTKDGRVKILDFGLARTHAPAAGALPGLLTTETSGPGADHTEAGILLGTTGYMSPEQVRGEPLDGRSDLFALGLVLWEMATGRGPFHRPSRLETLNAILREEPPPLDPGLRVPPGLERILRSCLAKDPGGRFHSAHDLAFALDSVEGSAPHPGAGAAASAPRRLILALGLALAIAAAAGGLAWRLLRPIPGAAPAAHVPSLMVLPTRVLNAPESAYLEDAIPDTLSTLLGAVAGLDTKLPQSSRQLEPYRGDLAKVALANRVDYLVLSTVTAQGENLALNVKLAEGATQKVKWAGQFQGTRGTYNELSSHAAEGLARALSPGPKPLPGELGNSELELALGEGRHFYLRYGSWGRMEDFEQGRSAYERAMTLDPARPEPPARLALLLRVRFMRLQHGADIQEAADLARRAVRLGPGSPDAWLSLMWAEMEQNHLEACMDCVWKYTSLRPGDPRAHALIAGMADGPGSGALCLAGYRHAWELGLADGLIGNFTYALACAGRSGEVLQVSDRLLALNPELLQVRLSRALGLVEVGRLGEAAHELEICRAESEAGVPWVKAVWQDIHFALAFAKGDPQASRQMARPLVSHLLVDKSDRYTVSFSVPILAPRLVRLGMEEEALKLMRKAIDDGNGMNLDWLCQDPDLQKLRQNPGFQEILAATRGQCAKILKNFEAAKARGELPGYLEGPLAEFHAWVDRP